MQKQIKLLRALPGLVPYAARFLAQQLMLDREVEMRLLPETADEAGRERFLTELKELLVLDHPAFLPVMENGITRGRPFFVVPSRDDPTLATLGADPGFDLEARVRAVRSLAQAMAAAHAAGLFLGPVAPQLVAWNRSRSQVQFVHHRSDGAFDPAMLESTPADVRPPAPPSARADVFHWANLAYWLLTSGRRPWAGRSQPLPIRVPVPNLGRDLAHGIEACLAEDPELRPEHMGEVEALLEAAAENVVPDEEIPLEASGTIPVERMGANLRRLREAGKVAAAPVTRAIPVPVLEERDIVEGPIPRAASVPRPVAGLALGVVGLLVLAGLARVPGAISAALRRAGNTRPAATGSPKAPPPLGGTDLYLRFLAGREQVTPTSFRGTWRVVRGLETQKALPERLRDGKRLLAMLEQFGTAPEVACRALEEYLAELREALREERDRAMAEGTR